MKRMMVMATAAALAACSGTKDTPATPESAPAEATAAAAPASLVPPLPPPPAPPGAARAFRDANDLYAFDYSYPAEAGAIPALRKRLDRDLADQLFKLKDDATKGEAEAQTFGFPYHAYYWSQKWSVVTNLPQWLSLTADYGNFTGGAHGMYWFGALLWDRQANRPRDPLDLFTSKQAFAQALRAPFCAALNRQRAKKRGTPVAPGSSDEFDKCIDPADETVILGSKDRFGFDRIGIRIAPYNAGPYAEGAYEVTLPVTPAVIAAVRPEFRASFAPGQ
jgi:hypothetical protein